MYDVCFVADVLNISEITMLIIPHAYTSGQISAIIILLITLPGSVSIERRSRLQVSLFFVSMRKSRPSGLPLGSFGFCWVPVCFANVC